MPTHIYTDEHKFLVERLRKARIEAGLEQKQVAALLGRPQSFVSRVESGQRRVDVIELMRFAELYKKRLSYFIKGKLGRKT